MSVSYPTKRAAAWNDVLIIGVLFESYRGSGGCWSPSHQSSGEIKSFQTSWGCHMQIKPWWSKVRNYIYYIFLNTTDPICSVVEEAAFVISSLDINVPSEQLTWCWVPRCAAWLWWYWPVWMDWPLIRSLMCIPHSFSPHVTYIHWINRLLGLSISLSIDYTLWAHRGRYGGRMEWLLKDVDMTVSWMEQLVSDFFQKQHSSESKFAKS